MWSPIPVLTGLDVAYAVTANKLFDLDLFRMFFFLRSCSGEQHGAAAKGGASVAMSRRIVPVQRHLSWFPVR